MSVRIKFQTHMICPKFGVLCCIKMKMRSTGVALLANRAFVGLEEMSSKRE